MTKYEKKQRALLPGGIGANVIERDLGLALRIWKQDLKKSGNLQQVFAKRGFVSKSQKRKETIDGAKHRMKFEKISQK